MKKWLRGKVVDCCLSAMRKEFWGRLILSFSLFLFVDQAVSQTCIVVTVKNNTIYIGADSKVRIYDKPSPIPYCKIRRVSEFYYACSGLAGIIGTPFMVDSIVRREGTRSGQIVARLEAAESLVGKTVADVFKEERGRGALLPPRTYNETTRIAFAWFQNDTARVRITSFTPFIDSLGRQTVRWTVDACSYDAQGVYAIMGDVQEVTQQTFTNKTPLEAIRAIIETAIKMNPEHIGPPIDILEISKNGPKWIQKKNECGED